MPAMHTLRLKPVLHARLKKATLHAIVRCPRDLSFDNDTINNTSLRVTHPLTWSSKSCRLAHVQGPCGGVIFWNCGWLSCLCIASWRKGQAWQTQTRAL